MLLALEIQGQIPIIRIMDQWSSEWTVGSSGEAVDLESFESEGKVDIGSYS